MNFTELEAAHFEEIVQLFEATFTASEGVEEGTVIGDLSRNLINKTASDDIFVFGAAENSSLEGCIIFTRLTYGSSKQNVFVMGPVAVASGECCTPPTCGNAGPHHVENAGTPHTRLNIGSCSIRVRPHRPTPP